MANKYTEYDAGTLSLNILSRMITTRLLGMVAQLANGYEINSDSIKSITTDKKAQEIAFNFIRSCTGNTFADITAEQFFDVTNTEVISLADSAMRNMYMSIPVRNTRGARFIKLETDTEDEGWNTDFERLYAKFSIGVDTDNFEDNQKMLFENNRVTTTTRVRLYNINIANSKLNSSNLKKLTEVAAVNNFTKMMSLLYPRISQDDCAYVLANSGSLVYALYYASDLMNQMKFVDDELRGVCKAMSTVRFGATTKEVKQNNELTPGSVTFNDISELHYTQQNQNIRAQLQRLATMTTTASNTDGFWTNTVASSPFSAI